MDIFLFCSPLIDLFLVTIHQNIETWPGREEFGEVGRKVDKKRNIHAVCEHFEETFCSRLPKNDRPSIVVNSYYFYSFSSLNAHAFLTVDSAVKTYVLILFRPIQPLLNRSKRLTMNRTNTILANRCQMLRCRISFMLCKTILRI